MKAAHKSHQHHISKRLITQIRLFILIFIGMFGFVLYDALTSSVNLSVVGIGAGFGLIVGLILSRMYKLSWDKNEEQVVGNIDRLGMVILVLYIGFVISRNWLFGNFIHGPSLGVFTLSITAFSMLGRVIMSRHGIHDILESVGIS